MRHDVWGLSLRHAEPARGGGFGERLGHLRESPLKRLAVDAGGGDGLPAYPVLPGPQLVHPLGGKRGFDAVLDGLRLLLGFLDQALELPQIPALALQFAHAHDVYLLDF